MSPHRESSLIDWLRRRAGETGRLIGDDAALLTAPGDLAVSVDHQIAGVHFPPSTDPRRVARRLLAVNLSDLAAVGARPTHAFLALAAPADTPLEPFLTAMIDGCRGAGVLLGGGDIARAETLHTSLVVLGRRPPRGRWVRRSGARPGDRLWLGGTVGESACGCRLLAAGADLEGSRVRLPRAFASPPRLAAAARRAVRRHLAPEPQLELGEWLGRRRRAAAIDLSDGLALDLDRLTRASGVGATLTAERLPLAPHAAELAERLGDDAVRLALSGGEDYVLLFALPPSIVPPRALACHPIGRVTSRRGLRLETDGHSRRLEADGWDHRNRG